MDSRNIRLTMDLHGFSERKDLHGFSEHQAHHGFGFVFDQLDRLAQGCRFMPCRVGVQISMLAWPRIFSCVSADSHGFHRSAWILGTDPGWDLRLSHLLPGQVQLDIIQIPLCRDLLHFHVCRQIRMVSQGFAWILGTSGSPWICMDSRNIGLAIDLHGFSEQ